MEEMQVRFTTRSGKEVTMKFPSARRVSKVQKLLGIDVLQDGLNGVKLGPIVADDLKMRDLMQWLIDEPVTDELLDEFTVKDMRDLIIAFFLRMWAGTLSFKNGLASLLSITAKESPAQSPPKDSPLTPPSIMLDTET